jgi:hypothetical protein
MNDNCGDVCYIRGEDVSKREYQLIVEHRKEIESLLDMPLDNLLPYRFVSDDDFSEGGYTHTMVIDDMCSFHIKTGRGCVLHTFKIKPMVGSLFPMTFNCGLLSPSKEIFYNLDDCHNYGKTLYEGGKNDLLYYFGRDFIQELDELSKRGIV